FDSRLWMEDFLAPFFGDHAEIENHGSFRSLEAELAVHGFHRFDGGKRNLQAKLAAEEDLARFEQGLSFGFLLARTDRAFHFVSHGGSPPVLPSCSGSLTLRRCVWPADDAHDSKLIRSVATTVTNPVDWKLIWAQRGFRYFFLAMFVSLFGSGMNFTGVSWYIISSTHSTVKVSLQVIVVTLPGLLVPFLGGVLIDRLDRRYLGIMLDLARGVAVLFTAYIAWHSHLQLWHLYAMTLITGMGSAMYWATVNALVQEVIPKSQFTGANAAV